MTDRVSSMIQEQSCAPVYFLKFINATAQNPDAIICCFEGEDQKYYSVRLNLLAPSLKWKGISCDGKKKVLDLYKIISEHDDYKCTPVVYFIDRDFDEPILKNLRTVIYETPCYSIENFYCTKECITRVFEIEFKLDDNSARRGLINAAWAHFNQLRDQFHLYMRPVNVWIKAHRKKEKLAGESEKFRKLNLNNVNTDKFVQISWDSVTLKVAPDQIHTLFPMCFQISVEELRETEEQLPQIDPELVFRGKYELEFVRQYLTMLKTKCSDSQSEFYNSGCSIRLQCTKNNAISELSQYATTPKCLADFISGLMQGITPSNS